MSEDMVAPLQQSWIESMYQYVPKSLRINFAQASKDFLEVRKTIIVS